MNTEIWLKNSVSEVSGFADGQNEMSPDSEKIERCAAELQKRNFSSVEQIQDKSIKFEDCYDFRQSSK